VINFGRPRAVYLHAKAVDMRKGFDGLFGLVKEGLGYDPLSGSVFAFTNVRRDRLKVLFFDGSGLWVCAKRLERGRFFWPKETTQSAVELTPAQLGYLVAGLEPMANERKGWYRR